MRLAAETVDSAALSLQGVNDIHGSHSFPARVLGISESIANDTFEEEPQNVPNFIVDQRGNALDATTPRQTPNSRLRHTADGVAQLLAMALGGALAQSLATLAAAAHFCEGNLAGFSIYYCSNSPATNRPLVEYMY